MSDLFALLAQAKQGPGPWYLITIVEALGSTYRKVGAHLLVHSDGSYLGMLSGGCLEAEVVARCAPLLRQEVAMLELTIDTRRLLGCDGQLTLIAEVLPAELTEDLALLIQTRQPAKLFTHRAEPTWQPSSIKDSLGEAFVQDLIPRLRLLVFGSGPGAKPLLEMSLVLGWQAEQFVLVSDPALRRESDASWTILSDTSELNSSQIDERTVCVVMNHHIGRDREFLRALWNTSTPYLAMVGSRKRRDQILESLVFSSDSTIDLDSRELYAPAGLDLGADGPAEIALEICAQIQNEMSKTGSPQIDPDGVHDSNRSGLCSPAP